MSNVSTIVNAVAKAKVALGTLVITGVLTSATAGVYNPDNGTNAASETTHNVEVAITAYSQYERKDTDIRASDLKVILFGGVVEPKTGDYLTLNSGKLHVINCEPVYAGEVVVIYMLQCRR
jgi:hypothetical protein